jgi:replicative DNA helicase
MADKKSVKTGQERVEELLQNAVPMQDYAATFVAHCTAPIKRISTGYLAIDKVLNGGLSNELYIMGAETSTGKSAFLMSIAQKIAEAGTDVLYFALEMGRDEFVARGISSISYERSLADSSIRPLTAGNVLYWTYDNKLSDFLRLAYSSYSTYADEYFARYGEHLHIIESGLSGLTVKDIANVAALYKRQHPGRQVVVFVDYLQIIKADPDDRTQSDRKTKTDVVVTTLKVLASQIGMPVVTISSIGRASYNGSISSASFKESGDTEYTGGVLIGWNWNGVTNQTDEEKREEEKKTCKKRGYRKMILDILKYRNSERDSSVRLKYYPAYNYFEEDDGFDPVTDNDQTPFTSNKPIIRA